MPEGVTGLIPDGSTKVAWRWMGDIFEDDAQDVLNNSIVVRNLQELGVDSIEALKYLFPSKTDEERAAMLTGYPFRMVQATQQSINTFISDYLAAYINCLILRRLNFRWRLTRTLDITGFLYRSLEFLRKELSYSGKYHPDSSDEQPSASLSAADERRAASGRPSTRANQPDQAFQASPAQAPQVPAYQASAPAPQASAPAGIHGSRRSRRSAQV